MKKTSFITHSYNLITDDYSEPPSLIIKSRTHSLKSHSKKNNNILYQSPHPKFRQKLLLLIRYFDNHPSLFSLSKFLSGFIFIILPLLTTLIYPYLNNSSYLKFYFLPYIISAGLLTGLLLLLLIYKLGDVMFFFLTLPPSWERLGILKIVHCLIIFIFILILLKSLENFANEFPFMKELIAQSEQQNFYDTNIKYKEINLGMYLLNVFVACSFWDMKTFSSLGYFEYAYDFSLILQKNINTIVNSSSLLSIVYIIKMFFFQTKDTLIYSIICSIVLYECILFKTFKGIFGIKIYTYNGSSLMQFIEVFPLFILLLCFIALCVKRYIISLFKRKYTTYISKRGNVICLIMVIVSLVIVICGIVAMLIGLCYLVFNMEIEHTLERRKMQLFKIFIWLGGILYCGGNAFYFGHCAFDIVMGAEAFGNAPATLKNTFYIKVKGRGRKGGYSKGKGRKLEEIFLK